MRIASLVLIVSFFLSTVANAQVTGKDSSQNEFMSIDPGGLPQVKMNIPEFFNKNMLYPQAARDSGIMGTVFVKVLVNKNGSIDSVVLGKGLKRGGAGLNTEAIRLVKLLPPGCFTSPTRDGNPSEMWISIPVRFVLDEKDKSKR
jgi:protein TonB